MLRGMRIGVLLGGMSSERDVSLRSGRAVSGAIRSLGYDVVEVDAGRDLCAVLEREKIGVAFIALHGGTGEDGSVQGLLEVMGIPYTGSGVLASAMAMDKVVSKIMFQSHGLSVPRYEVVRDADARISLKAPVVVKPAGEGSSVGVSIVKEGEKLREALKAALSFSGIAIVEEYIRGREVHIGVIGGKALGGVEVRPKREFYSYEAKYTSGLTEYILPPELDDALYDRAKEAGCKAHEALGARGATRVDLLIDERGRIYVLEVNSIPGMTETSLLPKIAAHAGLDFPALILEILRDALAGRGRHVK